MKFHIGLAHPSAKKSKQGKAKSRKRKDEKETSCGLCDEDGTSLGRCRVTNGGSASHHTAAHIETGKRIAGIFHHSSGVHRLSGLSVYPASLLPDPSIRHRSRLWTADGARAGRHGASERPILCGLSV